MFVVVVVIVAVRVLKSDCVGSLPNNVVEIVIAFEVLSMCFEDIWVYVVAVVVVIVAVGLLKSDCVGSLLNIVVEIVIAFEVSKIVFVDIGVFFVAVR